MPGLEVGDIAEKIVPLVQFPLLMRTILPGALATAILYPFLPFPPGLFRVLSLKDLEEHGFSLLAVAVLIFVSGALIALLNGQIYELYEGRWGWPSRLLNWSIAKQQSRVNKLQALKKDKESTDSGAETKRSEARNSLLSYPMNREAYYASRPTALGNILAAYEQYPYNRYGMSSVFYFTRIWMQMEKEKKEEIDSSWSIADGFLNLSATAMAGGLLWLAAATLSFFEVIEKVPLGDWLLSALGGLGWLILGYWFYRISLPFHRKNGELFKSIFDLYRDKIWNMTKIKTGEVNAWLAAWRYYQFRMFPVCRACGTKGTPGTRCEECGRVVSAFR
jgi:hypothetical protein